MNSQLLGRSKAETVELFQQRLVGAMEDARLSRSALSGHAGIDRSTLTQLLASDTVRLPRADTVVALARALGVTSDWLLGLATEERAGGNMLDASPEVALRPRTPTPADEHLTRWHREAMGYKIRFVPSGLPDFAKTEKVLQYEYRQEISKTTDQAIAASHSTLETVRLPETDMEACIERQQLEIFAAGAGIWSNLSDVERITQLRYMAKLLDDLYPGLRVYAYDGHAKYSAPFTVFGPHRVALFLGPMYLVLSTTDQVRMMARHFDELIRSAVIYAHDMPRYLIHLAECVEGGNSPCQVRE